MIGNKSRLMHTTIKCRPVLSALLFGLASLCSAQTAQKPSGYQYAERMALQPAPAAEAPSATAISAPSGLSRDDMLQAVQTRPWLGDEKWSRQYQAGISALNQLSKRSEFDRLARVYDAGTVFEMPHVLFLLDTQGGNRVDFIHSRQFIFHEDYIRARYAPEPFTRAQINTNYELPHRRFILGTLSWQNALQKWTYELWQGDNATPAHIALLQKRLGEQFFAPVSFKANSMAQEKVARAAVVPLVTQAQIMANQRFQPLQQGAAIGRLRWVKDEAAAAHLQPQDIALLAELPLSLPPVAGIVSGSPSTVLSHINVLAKSWNIPNAYVRDAPELLKALDGRWVRFQVTRTGYVLEPAMPPTQATPIKKPKKQALVVIDSSRQNILPLGQLRRASSLHCGAKAANLGAIQTAIRHGALTGTAAVPDGFCVPFAHYLQFMAQPAVQAPVARALAIQDPVLRQKTLLQLQSSLLNSPVAEAQSAQWLQAWKAQLGSRAVFVRSSSNAEDLPNFSGAGLFTTVPNVTSDAALLQAIKTVWLSTLNWPAQEALRRNGIAHHSLAMAVFVQAAVAAQSSGVMVTRDPFDARHRNASYISAKRGLGIRVVEGKKVAEQVLFDRRSGAIQLLSLSADDKSLVLDKQGGVKEVATPLGQAVLNETLVHRLDAAGVQLKKLFDGQDQDVEWATDERGQLVILQSRPFAAH